MCILCGCSRLTLATEFLHLEESRDLDIKGAHEVVGLGLDLASVVDLVDVCVEEVSRVVWFCSWGFGDQSALGFGFH
jgi:hypothetical protein